MIEMIFLRPDGHRNETPVSGRSTLPRRQAGLSIHQRLLLGG
jgi:hypothetical protein